MTRVAGLTATCGPASRLSLLLSVSHSPCRAIGPVMSWSRSELTSTAHHRVSRHRSFPCATGCATYPVRTLRDLLVPLHIVHVRSSGSRLNLARRYNENDRERTDHREHRFQLAGLGDIDWNSDVPVDAPDWPVALAKDRGRKYGSIL
jgi:hypothetical protein